MFEEKAGLVRLDLISRGGSVTGARLSAPQPLARGEDIGLDVVANACSIEVSDIEAEAITLAASKERDTKVRPS